MIEPRELARLRRARRELFRELVLGPDQARADGRRLTRRERNVVAVEIGERLQGGQPTYEWCLRVVVQRKFRRMPALRADRLPRGRSGIAVDVVQGGGPARSVHCIANPLGRAPSPPGVIGGLSIGRRLNLGSDGTAGVVVRRAGDPFQYILTNRHVVEVPGSSGATQDPRINQPGRSSGAPVVGSANPELLFPLEFGDALNRADAALVRLRPTVLAVEGALNCLGSLTGVLLDPAKLREAVDERRSVTLSGSRHRGSAGILFGFESGIVVRYDSGLRAVFDGQLSVRAAPLDPLHAAPFAGPGDSGALIVMPSPDQGLVAVGLLHSVSEALAFASPLEPIWKHFGLEGLEPV